MAKLGYRDNYQPHYRINTYRTYLRSAGFVANTSRGKWMVLHRIPSWATLSALEIARGYKGTEAQRKAVRANIAQYKQAGAQPTWAFKIGDTIQVGTDETVYTIEQHPTRANDVYITWVDKGGKQSITYDKSYIHTLLTKKNPHWKLVTPKPVAPKVPLDLPKKETQGIVVGASVQLKASAKKGDWVLSEGLEPGITYKVTQISQDNYIKVSGPKARGTYWVSIKYFKVVKSESVKAVAATHNEICVATFKVGDKVRFLASKTPTSFYNEADYYTKQAGLKPTGIYTVSKVGKFNSTNTDFGKAYIRLEGHDYNHPYDCFELVKEEQTPKPVEAKKPRLMLCVDMNDSPADYTVGKVYELSNEDDDYYYFKRNDQGVGGGGMFKYRFKELKDGVANSVKVLCTNNAGGYRDLLTVGKTYEAVSSIDGEDFWTIPVSDKGTQATAYKHRFTVLTDEAPKQETPKKKVVYCIDNKMSGVLTIGKEYEVVKDDRRTDGIITVVNDKGVEDWYRGSRFSDTNPKRKWKVGDTLLSSFLNDPNIEKEFHGYDAGWNIYAERVFMHDRKVEVIQEREGKRAARISGTMDIWITLESLERHP
jgi:hypothetical protein